MGRGNLIRLHYILPQETLPPWPCLPSHVWLHGVSMVGHMQGK